MHTARVAGVDGSHKGWAIVIGDSGKLACVKFRRSKKIFEYGPFHIVTIASVPAIVTYGAASHDRGLNRQYAELRIVTVFVTD